MVRPTDLVAIEVRAGDVRTLLEAVEEMCCLAGEDGTDDERDSLKRLHRAIRKAEQEQVHTH